MAIKFSDRPRLITLGFALITLILHMAVSTNYELHRDAYLYLAESRHLAWGYLSIPPLTPFIAHYWTALLGDSTFAVRLIPAVVGALSILVIGRMVRELGGGAWAVFIACLAYLVSPAFLRANSLFQPVSIDSFFWLLAAWAMLRLLHTENPRWWLALGMITGLGFLNKYSIAFPALSFVIGLSLTQQRRLFNTRWLVYGLIAGLVIILPNLFWQYSHNWPVIHHMAELRANQLVHVELTGFLIMQLFMILPAVPVFIIGLGYLLGDKRAKPYRAVGWTYIVLVLMLMMLSGKPYYTMGIYPVMFVFGALAITRYTANIFEWSRFALAGFMVLIILPAVPVSMPVLSFTSMVRYGQGLNRVGMSDLLRWEDGTKHPLPQDYADMTGWEEMASIVDNVWNNLSPEERGNAAIYAENYGRAGAISYYLEDKGIPEPISFSDNYLLWAPDSIDIHTLIYVNSDTSDIRKLFREVTLAGRVGNPFARERGVSVYVCRHPLSGFKQFYAGKVAGLKTAYRRAK